MSTTLKAKLEAAAAHNPQWKEDAVAVVEDLLARVGTFAERTDAYRKAAKERRESDVPADAALVKTPADVIDAIDEVTKAERTLVFDLNDLASYVVTLIPPIKEEDNSGVAVQQAFLDLVKETVATLNGAGKDANPRLVHLGAKAEYLAKRSELEMKLAPTGKDAEAPASESLRRAMHEVDNATVANVAATFAELRRACLTVASAFIHNQGKIEKPRRDGSGMIG
uniref:Proteasome activator PA28 C-terminal domain-containing protein n=1 Tax=Neobodo designis TaxID=312471 RepID=A0A7S1PUI7_NEODS|mmetsp:Transcript_2237/g.6949  ORF Transcript_2237/g.6949 Transcript_2237/m.6949 type:complete len:225 (+) Transcript_2237:59-733(+)